MLTLVNMAIDNNPYKAGIEIVSSAATASTGGITKMVIARAAENGSYENVYEKNISSVGDLNFKLLDITAKAQHTYNYRVNLYSGSALTEFGFFNDIKCWFNGLFIGNFDKYYVSGANFTFSVQRNTQGDTVTTLSGKYPYYVSNADTNYTSGTAAGMFLPYSLEQKQFILDMNSEYQQEVVDFLADGTGKILRTHNGQQYYVMVGNNVKYADGGCWGMTTIDFSWTEIGEVPSLGMVVE